MDNLSSKLIPAGSSSSLPRTGKTLTNGDLIATYYIVMSKLTETPTSDIFIARDRMVDTEYIVKVATKNKRLLSRESEIYTYFADSPVGIPKLITSGCIKDSKEDPVSFIILQKLGNTIKHYWEMCGNQFSAVTVANIAIQILQRLQSIHSKGVLHREINVSNMVMGITKEEETLVYLIDFGLSKSFLTADGEHFTPIKKETVTYVSSEGSDEWTMTTENRSSCSLSDFIGSTEETDKHIEGEISRRDDLVSFGLEMVRLLRGSLPWELLPSLSDRLRVKNETTHDMLYTGLPQPFRLYFMYVDSLKFSQKPNYHALQLLFKDFVHGKCHRKRTKDSMFDWITHPDYVSPSK